MEASTEEGERGIPQDEGTKDERQGENKEETMGDRTGIDRVRRETRDIENIGGINGRNRV